jgi:hypothetical protein
MSNVHSEIAFAIPPLSLALILALAVWRWSDRLWMINIHGGEIAHGDNEIVYATPLQIVALAVHPWCHGLSPTEGDECAKSWPHRQAKRQHSINNIALSIVHWYTCFTQSCIADVCLSEYINF